MNRINISFSLLRLSAKKKNPQKTKKLYFPNPRRHRKQHNHQRLSFNIKKKSGEKKTNFCVVEQVK